LGTVSFRRVIVRAPDIVPYLSGRGSYFRVGCVVFGMEADTEVLSEFNLEVVDIQFLQAVRNINENPDEYAKTESGVTAASTLSLRNATELSRNQIRYRMGGSRCRGLAEAGLTEVYDAVLDEDGGYGPKSIELTEKGEEVLREIEEQVASQGRGASPGEVEDLRERVAALEGSQIEGEVDTDAVVGELEALRSRVDGVESAVESVGEDVTAIQSVVDELQSSAWGSIDEEIVDDLVLVLRRAPVMIYVFSSVLSVDIDEIVEEGSFSEEELADVQAELFLELASAAGVSFGDETEATTEPVDGGVGQRDLSELKETSEFDGSAPSE
jgi:polyhydroxyalkanoate synthesis regulator phasin